MRGRGCPLDRSIEPTRGVGFTLAARALPHAMRVALVSAKNRVAAP